MFVGQDYTLVVDLGAEGIPASDVYMKAPTSLAFVHLDLEAGVFQEAGHGYYNITIPKALIIMPGTYVFWIVEADVFTPRECTLVPLSSVIAPEVCIITGNVRNASAKVDAFEQIAVTAKPLRLPQINAGSLTLGKSIVTYTDHSGFFQLPLIRGMTALIEIRDVGVRFQIVVPDLDTVRIEDIIPQ